MEDNIKNEIQVLINRLVKNKEQGFLTIPNSYMLQFEQKKIEMQEMVESGEKSREEAKKEFEAFFKQFKIDLHNSPWVINLRDPDTNEILVEDCTIRDLEFFLMTGELTKENN